jgi:hypothetical protein
MARTWLVATAFAGLLSIVPARPPDADAERARAELLALHQADRRAHFSHDIGALLATPPAELIYVRDGKVEHQSKEQLRHRFEEHRTARWAGLILRVKIAYAQTDPGGKKTREQTVMAWMSAYEKRDGKWLHIANIITVEPN